MPNNRFESYEMVYRCFSPYKHLHYGAILPVLGCMIRPSRLNKSKQRWLCNSRPLDSGKNGNYNQTDVRHLTPEAYTINLLSSRPSVILLHRMRQRRHPGTSASLLGRQTPASLPLWGHFQLDLQGVSNSGESCCRKWPFCYF